MNFRRISKFTLSAMLLTAGVLAYAEGEITLLNGDTVTWSQFVNSVNSSKPTNKEFNVELLDNDPAKVALATANQKVTDAKAAVTTAQGVVTEKETAVTTAEGVVTEKEALVAEDSKLYTDSVAAEQGVKTAQQAIDNYVKDNIDPIKATIASNNSTIAKNKETISTLQTQQQTLNADLTTATSNRTAAKEKIDNAEKAINNQVSALEKQLTVLKDTLAKQNSVIDAVNNQINALPKKRGVVGWLKTMISTAELFKNNATDNPDNTSPTIYYQKVDDSEPSDPYFILNLAILPENPAGNWAPINPYQFYQMTRNTNSQTYQVYNEVNIYIYDINNPTQLVSKNVSYTNARSILINVNSYLDQLSLSAIYQTTTDELENPQEKVTLENRITAYTEKYITPQQQKIAEKESEITAKEGELTNPPAGSDLALAQAEYNQYNDEITGENGINAQLNSLKTQIQNLQNENTNLNNQLNNEYKIKNEEGVEVTMPSLNTQLQNAIDGQATVDAGLTTAQDNVKQANAAIAAARADITAAEQAVKDAKEALTNAQNDLATKQAAVPTAEAEVTTATEKLAAAQKTANEEAATAYMVNFNNITLAANSTITVDQPITVNYNGQIWANGSIITNKTSGPVFTRSFKGELHNAAINGSFAQSTVGATFSSVVRWDGNGKIYNESGVLTEYNASEHQDAFGAFGYALRNNTTYGVDFNGTKIVAAADAPSKVFSLTAYDLPSGQDSTEPDPTQTYVQLSQKGSSDMVTLENNAITTYKVPQNRFAQSATADVAGLGLSNVYYGTNNDCDNVKIVDRVDFFCPVTVKAKAINYNRSLTKGYNSVCLPFDLEKNYSSSILSICEYEGVDFDTKKFWFKESEEDGYVIKANTPALIVTNADNVTLKIGAVKIAATNAEQLVSADAMYSETKSYGTYKQAKPADFVGMQYKDYIYGLTKEGKFMAGAENATFPSFRMVIGTKQDVNPKSIKGGARAAEYVDVMNIGIHNGNGKDITNELMGDIETGIDNVTEPAMALEVAGGMGEIIFNSDANYGKVAVYTIDGKVVAMANIMEGQSSVSVAKGMYIVMGKKVMVK